jgi:hypothetical protein
MSDTSKFPFDSVPLDGGGTAAPSEPRPAFSRNSVDVSTSGLLPPSRRPLSVATPEPTPPVPPPAPEPPAPNPMASTPPPKAGSLSGFLWDMVRPTRTKWAILAGGASLAAGAYGLNLFVPTPGQPAMKSLPETANLAGPGPQVIDERQRQPSVGEERVVKPAPTIGEERTAAVPPVVKDPPAPLPALPPAAPVVPVPAAEPIRLVRNEQPADPLPLPGAIPPPKPDAPAPLPPVPKSDVLPPVPGLDDKPKAAPLPPVPGLGDKPEPAAPLPPIKPAEPTPAPPPVVKPADPAPPPSVVMPGGMGVKPEVPAAPKPSGFVETPDPIPAPPPVIDPKPVPLPGVKVTPVVDGPPPPITGLPPKGTPAEVPVPKPAMPADPIPAPPVKPVDQNPSPVFTEKKPDLPPPLTPPVKPEPVAVPSAFKEEKTAPVPVGGGPESPPAPAGGPPPKKGFEVDVVKVRPTDTYTSISEAFYQSKKHAAALRAFNGDVDISRLQEVEVPPLFELQKLTGTPARDAEPTGRTVSPRSGSEPPVRGPVIEPTAGAGESVDWGPVGKRRSVIKYERFTTPKEGMTARDVARAVYADENEWPKLLGPRGARLRADEPLPRGTELTVPREELPWK